MKKTIKVGMADLKIGSENDILATLGLGSCVGIVIYDKKNKLAGMAHVMLPSSKEIRNNGNKAKFVDTAINELIEELIKRGAKLDNLVSKIAGGAQMYKIKTNSDLMQIGKRNVKATKKLLAERKIELIAEETGSNYGRTIEFYVNTGELHIKAIGKKYKII